MKWYQMFVCEVCGKESKNQKEIELCEAKHIGLNSILDYHEYQKLKETAKQSTWLVGNKANDRTRSAEDKAYNDLLEFEKLHDMTVK